MKIKKYFLNFFILLIGVIIVSPLFFSTPVHADSTGNGYWSYTTVVDSISATEVTDYTYGDKTYQRYHYDGYVHEEITITTDSDYSFGIVKIYGNNYHYSGRTTYYNTASHNHNWNFDTRTNGSNVPSYDPRPPFTLYNLRGSFDTTIIDNSTIAELEYRTKSIDFKGYTTDFQTITNPTGAVTLSPDNYLIFENINWEVDHGMVLYNITLPVGGNLKDINDFKFYLRYKDEPYDITEIPVYAVFDTLSRSYFNFYFTIQNAYRYGAGFDLVVQPLKQYRYYPSNFNKTLNYILPTDKYYNELTFYINTYEYYHRNTVEVGDVNNSNSSFQSSSEQMIQLEDQLQGDFNSAIGSIDIPSNPFNDFGTAFGNSSRFLVHMFDQLTIHNGSPFGTVITFSLILGLAMLMIGKKGS